MGLQSVHATARIRAVVHKMDATKQIGMDTYVICCVYVHVISATAADYYITNVTFLHMRNRHRLFPPRHVFAYNFANADTELSNTNRRKEGAKRWSTAGSPVF